MSQIRTLIVDDEPLARERLRQLLADDPEIEVVAECVNGPEAVAGIEEHHPDLVFLDIHMPEMDGFAVLESVPPEIAPAVIFITAYDKHALQAFEVNALDYLVKPFDKERFQKALARAKQQAANAHSVEASQRLLNLLSEVRNTRNVHDRLAIRAGGRVFFLRYEEIDWIESAGNYVKLHVNGEEHLHREALMSVEARLDPDRFLRIHRTTIVNVERIEEMCPAYHGDYDVILRDGTRLTMSRHFRPRLQEIFGSTI